MKSGSWRWGETWTWAWTRLWQSLFCNKCLKLSFNAHVSLIEWHECTKTKTRTKFGIEIKENFFFIKNMQISSCARKGIEGRSLKVIWNWLYAPSLAASVLTSTRTSFIRALSTWFSIASEILLQIKWFVINLVIRFWWPLTWFD